MRIKNALVYTVEHGFVERDVRIKNGCFAGSEAAGTDGEEILDAGGDYLIPGLVDIHFHGSIAGDRCVRASPGCDKHLPGIDDTLGGDA